MSFERYGDDEYEAIAARFQLYNEEDRSSDRPASPRKKPKKERQQQIAELADSGASLEDNFRITYRPARYEAVWLYDSLRPFVTQGLIEDVLTLVKGGKEANVYQCRAAQHLPMPFIAAKVYRPRQFRNLRNDKMYREGRELLNASGIPIKNRDNREMRAIRNKTAFGAELTHISWLMHEFITLQRLFELGAAVPEPLSAGGNAILMCFVGDRHRSAPTLHGVRLPRENVESLFTEVMRNVELMLGNGMVHGDLSAYNILYWRGEVTLIDFPQVTLSESNHNAYRIFQRDVRRVCEYFAGQGLARDPSELSERLWHEYVGLPPNRTVQDAMG